MQPKVDRRRASIRLAPTECHVNNLGIMKCGETSKHINYFLSSDNRRKMIHSSQYRLKISSHLGAFSLRYNTLNPALSPSTIESP